MPSERPIFPENRLAHETSPYLLQHRHNPVDWWPWGPQALTHARSQNKPILLSIGYAACHWCHVMAHESFEDPATAAVMNDLFVNIKVDREERPDIDQIYMAALHHLGEHGGWPLTMFLTPEGEPVWGGTYFPPTARYGKPAFTDVLRELARLFRDEPARIAQNRNALMQRLSEHARPAGKVVIGIAELDKLASHLADAIDPVNGGLQGAPKFPQAAIFELLWRAGLRAATPAPGTANNRFFDAVDLSLEHICEGGIYDHLGGGFARYSVDERWLVPHFEKMLYDNAHLLELLSLAFLRSGKPLYRQRAAETVAWLVREMTTPEGAFCASLDADSEGQEGKFYVWSLSEIETLLGEDTAFFSARYDVTRRGNFEGHTILNRLKDLPRNIALPADDEARLAQLRSRLLDARAARVRPGVDDKVLADWNGLMIAALVRASIAFGQPDWIQRAETAFRFIAEHMTRDDRLGHSWRAGRLLFPGLASDFAAMIRAALALYEATGTNAHRDQALIWQSALDRHHLNPETGGYFLTADDAEGLVIRPASTADDALANHNALAAENLVRLAAVTGDERWRQSADRLFGGLLPLAAANLFSHVALLNALDLRLGGAEIVVTGSGPRADALTAAALRLPHISRTVLRVPERASLPNHHPAQAQLPAAPADGAAFICRAETCSLPLTAPAQIAEALLPNHPH
jgi:uncharacterized protein YyaL (SSP411 family)